MKFLFLGLNVQQTVHFKTGVKVIEAPQELLSYLLVSIF